MHVVLAGGSVGLGACTDRAYDFGYVPPDGSGTDTDGTDPTATGGPTDPTVDPTTPVPPPPGVPGPPQLLDVQFLDNMTLSLTFNEAMAAPTGVDPSAFRLSIGFGSNYEPKYAPYDYGYKWTDYLDLQYFNGPEVCGENCWPQCYDPEDPYCYDEYYCYEYCYNQPGNPVHVASAQLDPADATRITVRLDLGVGSGVCDAVSDIGPNYVQAVFLHYTDDRGPVTDASGELLAPIGEQWALSPEDFVYVPNQFFPDLVPFLPIPCPF